MLERGAGVAREPDRITVAVPCNGCTACCSNDMLILYPELGDDPTQYETVAVAHPLTGKPSLMLKHKPEGGCIYLDTATGCTIHGSAPAICREFDCRRMFTIIGSARAARMVKDGHLSQEVVDAGRKRRRTLEAV